MKANHSLTVPDRHRLRIARDTLKLRPAMVAVMGGMTRAEAVRTIRELTGADPDPDPLDNGAPQS